jgi:predicted SAM-dependent methyltransferase
VAYEMNVPSAASLLADGGGAAVLETFAAAQRFAHLEPLRLHLGCGTVRLDGWVNIDIDGNPDLVLDLRFGLPFPDASVDLVHTEHMLEHLTLADGRVLLDDACRVLRPGGVMRIGVPDLEAIVRRYSAPDWRDQSWIVDGGFDWVDTPVALLNVAFRGWEHRYLYDEAELRFRLLQSGFAAVERVAWGQSATPELRGLETRAETDLIVEATR